MVGALLVEPVEVRRGDGFARGVDVAAPPARGWALARRVSAAVGASVPIRTAQVAEVVPATYYYFIIFTGSLQKDMGLIVAL